MICANDNLFGGSDARFKNTLVILNFKYVCLNLFTANHDYSAVQSQNTVSAYFTSKQILHIVFAEQFSRFKFALSPDKIHVSESEICV